MKNTILLIATCLLLPIALTAQTEYRFFELLKGAEKECARLRFQEFKEMLNDQDFSLLKHIYPKTNQELLNQLAVLSSTIKSYERIGNSGGVKYPCSDCEQLVVSHLIYQQNELEIDDLIAIQLVINKAEPFFIDTLIISDTLNLLNDVRENLQVKNVKLYPPFTPDLLGCFGSEYNFQIKLNEGDAPYLDGLDYGTYLKDRPQLLAAIEQMNLPIKASIICKSDQVDCVNGLGDLNRVNDLVLVIFESIAFPEKLLTNQQIENLELRIHSKLLNHFTIPDEIFQMSALRTLTINGIGNEVIKVSLPKRFYEEDVRIAIKHTRGKVGFVEKED